MLAPKKEFVEEFMEGYMAGHQTELEEMEPELMERKLIKVEGYAEGLYDTLKR